MPTKTKQTKLERLDAKTAEYERKLEAAREELIAVRQERAEAQNRQEEIALRVVEHDEEAVAEDERLTENIIVRFARRDDALRAACVQIKAKMAELEEKRREERYRTHRERYHELAIEKGKLEEECDALIDQLLAKLQEVYPLDSEQRDKASNAGPELERFLQSGPGYRPFSDTVKTWLLARLGGYGMPLGLDHSTHQHHQGKHLAWLDPLARAPKKGDG